MTRNLVFLVTAFFSFPAFSAGLCDYTSASSITGAECFVANQSSVTKTVTPSTMKNYFDDYMITSGETDDKFSRAHERLLVGEAAKITDANSQASTWMPDMATGAQWINVNAMGAFMAEDTGRLIALSGFTSSALGDSVAIGVSGAAYCDNSAKSCWSLYGDVQLEDATYAYGLEIALKNKTAYDWFVQPHARTDNAASKGFFGIQLSGGGDATYGGSPTYPNTAGIIFTKNASTWNRGIVFRHDSLTGATGTTGSAVAVEMARTHKIQWHNNAKNEASIGAEGDTTQIDLVVTPYGASGKLKTPRLNISSIPTSSSGLSSGDIWSDGGTLKIIP